MPTVSTIPFPRYSRSYDHKFAHFGKGDTGDIQKVSSLKSIKYLHRF